MLDGVHPSGCCHLCSDLVDRGYGRSHPARWVGRSRCCQRRALEFRKGSYTSPVTSSACSSTASLRATATLAMRLAIFEPLLASLRPCRFKSVSGESRRRARLAHWTSSLA